VEQGARDTVKEEAVKITKTSPGSPLIRLRVMPLCARANFRRAGDPGAVGHWESRSTARPDKTRKPGTKDRACESYWGACWCHFVNIRHETNDAQNACSAPTSDSETLKLYLGNGLGVQKDYNR
jgi:hypothetical protein